MRLAVMTFVAAMAAVLFTVAWFEEAACHAAGGVRMRPLFGVWQCYDAGSLKPVKKEGA